MRFVSFFAGIGGFDVGLERCGHECVGQVEIDPYALRVLERHWPDVPRFGDVWFLDSTELPDADLWCGGYPCQPHSVAGKRLGAGDERDLWPAFARLISRRRPRWLFLENVPGQLTSEGGRHFGGVIRDLAALGYVGEWTVLGARDVGAPHRRDRLWIVAHLADAERELRTLEQQRTGTEADASTGRYGEHWAMADADEWGLEELRLEEHAGVERASWREPDGCGAGGRGEGEVRDPDELDYEGRDAERLAREERSSARRAECWCGRGEPWCCDPADGATQPRLGRVAHGIPRRVDRLRCLGNAVVPQVVEAIARRVWERRED